MKGPDALCSAVRSPGPAPTVPDGTPCMTACKQPVPVLIPAARGQSRPRFPDFDGWTAALAHRFTGFSAGRDAPLPRVSSSISCTVPGMGPGWKRPVKSRSVSVPPCALIIPAARRLLPAGPLPVISAASEGGLCICSRWPSGRSPLEPPPLNTLRQVSAGSVPRR